MVVKLRKYYCITLKSLIQFSMLTPLPKIPSISQGAFVDAADWVRFERKQPSLITQDAPLFLLSV